MSLPNYRVLVSFDHERKVFLARTPELDHCSAEGATRAEAIARLEEEIQAQVQNMLGNGHQPPAPVDEETFSGEVSVKLSRQLHRDLVLQARTEGIDLDQLFSEMLSSNLEQRRSGGRQHRPNRGQHSEHDNSGNTARRSGNYGGGRYNANLLEDRANFIEYVRNLEHSGQGGHHPAPSGPGGRRRRNRGRGGPPTGSGGQGPNGNGKSG
jgi:predicted RNase H-like HicB family nuclease